MFKMENRRALIGRTAPHLPVLPKPAKYKWQNVFHSLCILLIFQRTFCTKAGGEIPSSNHAQKLFTTIFLPPADFFIDKIESMIYNYKNIFLIKGKI